MGFGVPYADWFRGELKPFLKENLLSAKSLNRGIFRPSKIENIVAKHVAGEIDYSSQLYAMIMLELWFQAFID
jgi:asparagine synthase (glutamine-hydrolysing)